LLTFRAVGGKSEQLQTRTPIKTKTVLLSIKNENTLSFEVLLPRLPVYFSSLANLSFQDVMLI
jgi:hypothetical protein